ncbi:ribonuclease T2-like protein [Xylariaceae sp. FL0804]|nr:ribonuclease T2-like protein [Xylariaceae sp. FL0804]
MSAAMRRVVALSLVSRGALAGLYPGMSTANHTCSLVPEVLSCSAAADPDLVDSCCAETFGGLVLQTQFWNTYTGLEEAPVSQRLPRDTWSIHGLWPDFCNGSYTQYCDLSRQYDPAPDPNTTTGTADGTPVPPWTGVSIDEFVKPFAKYDLLAFMRKYWVGQNEDSSVLWAHEFSKHATCYSVFDVACYGPAYRAHEDVVDFFATVAAYYRALPTWDWLAAAGIRPDNGTTTNTTTAAAAVAAAYPTNSSSGGGGGGSGHSLVDLQAALRAGFGALPYIGCSGPTYNETAEGAGSDDDGLTVLSEMWYYHHVYGRVQDHRAVRVDADIAGGSVTNCATTPGAIQYYERTPGSDVEV